MKRVQIIMCFVLIISSSAFSQNYSERIVIQAGNDGWTNLMKHVYRYPAFIEGTIKYKDGRTFQKALNYNKALKTILFLENGDTLMITEPEKIQTVSIENDVYFFSPDCYQTSNSSDKVKLVKHEILRVSDKKAVGAMGARSQHTSIETVNRRFVSMNDLTFDTNEVLLLRREVTYYVQTGGEELIPANKKNILRLFPSKEADVKQFINENNIGFNNDKDLNKLTSYLSKL